MPAVQAYSPQPAEFEFASSSSHVCAPHENPVTGRSVLYDNFFSHRTTGIRRPVLQCSDSDLLELCRLHGLKDADTFPLKTRRSKLLYHLFDGDCFGARCMDSSPLPDCSACLCIAAGFRSSSSITEFLISLLKKATPSEVSTEDLLFIIDSLGVESPYANRLNLRRRTVKSLETFLHLRRQRDECHADIDPYGDIFMAFEQKKKPALRAIMDHHGLRIEDTKQVSKEKMRQAIINHISRGDCARSVDASRTARSRQRQQCVVDDNDESTTCEDFVRHLPASNDVDACLKIFSTALRKIHSLKTLQRFLDSHQIRYDPKDNLTHLRQLLRRRIILLEKHHMDREDTSIENVVTSQWPTVVPDGLKDKIARNFMEDTSSDHLRSFVCASCSSSEFIESGRVTVNRSTVDLSCLQHPETRLSGVPPDRTNVSATNLDPLALTTGILIDRRGIENDNIHFCMDCHNHIRKKKVPPLSLANHLLLGDVPPELKDLTPVEESMIARCRAKVCIIQLRAQENCVLPNTQRGMHGNIIIYPQKPQELLNVLPPSTSDTCTAICVVFVGSHRPTQQWLRDKAKPLIVRRERVRSALLWLIEHNPLYHNVLINEQSMNNLPENDVFPVHIEVVDDSAIDTITARYDEPDCSTTPSHTTQKPQHMDDTIFQSVVVTGVEGDASVNQMRTAAMQHMKTKRGGFIEIPHEDKPANEFYSPQLLPMTYPTLFPYGLGGFEDLQRETSLSFKRQVKLFFSLADTRFQEHYSFLFTVFNILQRRAILLHTSLKVKKSSFDRFATEFEGISSETIHRLCERLAQSNGQMDISTASAEERRVLRLMKEVNVVNTHVPGSAAARVSMRNEIRALIMEKGLPSFYITINPADVYNPLVKFLSGHDIDIDSLLPEEVPDYMEQSILVARNPAIAAKFFNIYMNAFIKSILAYDPSNPMKSEGGILGPVSAYYGCVEAQGRGTLHCHMIVWLSDALNSDEIRNRVLDKDYAFQHRLINFINDSISNEIPPLPSQTTVMPSDNVHPCAVRGCNDLSNKNARQKDIHNVVKNCQTHKHSATCFKYWKGPPHPKTCRFDLGEHCVQKETSFNQESGELLMRHLDGFVNNFNTTMIELIRCNMDIQFLGSGPSTKAVIYYITDYITKAQLKAHVAYTALELAVKKLESSVTVDDLPTVRAKKLLQKCAYRMIGEQELSGQQVVSYLLEKEDHFTSHSFQRVYWTMYERVVDRIYPLPDTAPTDPEDQEKDVENVNEDAPLQDVVREETQPYPDHDEDDEVIIIADDVHLKAQTPYIQDYLLRGKDLETLSLWEYISLVQKIPKKKSNLEHDGHETALNMNHIEDENSYCRPKFNFQPSHPDYATHMQEIRHPARRPLPTPIGPSLPRRDKTETKEKYCRLMLLLLKPWIHPQDLIEDFTTFELSFQAFQQNNEKWTKLLHNMQLLHECRDSRDDHFQERHHLQHHHIDTQTESSYQADDDFTMHGPNEINQELLEHLKSIDNSRSHFIQESQQSVMQCLQEAELRGMFNHPVHQNSEHGIQDCLGNQSTEETHLQEQEWRHEYEMRRQNWKNTAIEQQQHIISLRESVGNSQPLITTIAETSPTIESALVTGNECKINDQEHKNLEHVRSNFTLNEEQARAFNMIAKHSIDSSGKQLQMFICGPGGTGKSRIIDALREFFHIQHEDHRIRLASYTGVAAKNIRGMTLHTALSLNQLNRRSSKAKADLISMWQKVDYLVIDEISMIGCKLMLRIHEALCEAKENTKPFGGINVICAGDFVQLPPVGDTHLYSHIHSTKVATPSGQKDVFGKLLWLSFDKVIILRKLVRQNSDMDNHFTELLGRLRTGACHDDDYSFLNSKLLRNSPTDFNRPPWNSSPIIVSNNDVKDAFNVEAAKAFAARTNQELHFYYAMDKRSGHLLEDEALKNKLTMYHSGKTDQRLGRLPLCKGMPVMITQNYDISNGIVNGCIGTLEKVNFTVDSESHRHAHSCVIFAEDTTGTCLPHLQKFEVVALEDETLIAFTHPHSNKKCTFKRTQLPITPAFALTAHKSQGSTLPAAILDLESCPTTEAAYVMLSRVKDSDHIRILRPFHKKKISTRISEDLRNEFKRLDFLDASTSNHTDTASSVT